MSKYFEVLSVEDTNYTNKYLRNANHANEVGHASMARIFCKESNLPEPEFPEWLEKNVDE